jgi:small subunit ribosomal protein S2
MANNNPTTVVSMKDLLEAGVHFGHRTRRWNPKMKPYIFTERNGIHIIDLQQTITHLNRAYEVVKETVASGGIVLFVGTKKQTQESLVAEASRCGMPYVNQRWLGGTLTNWRTIRQRIDYMLDMERRQARGEFARLPKKEALMREREIARLNHRLGGLKEMRRLPNVLFVVDIRRDSIAVREANILGIPVIAMVDTNCDPDPIDYVIPSNDDAIRALKLMNATIANAVLDGQAILSSLRAEEEEAATMEEEDAMERYLGPSTLAKIQEAAEAEAAREVVEEEIEEETVQAEEELEIVSEEGAVEEIATAVSSVEEEVVEEIVTADSSVEEEVVEEVAPVDAPVDEEVVEEVDVADSSVEEEAAEEAQASAESDAAEEAGEPVVEESEEEKAEV